MESIYEIDINGAKVWYNSNRLLHREDGPAIIYKNGTEYWYFNGLLHNINGPAIHIMALHYNSWYYHGKRIYCDSQEEFERLIKLKAFW